MTRLSALLILTLFTATACTPTLATRGNLLTDEQMQEVIPGLHTRTDVTRHLGSPTAIAPFDDNIWYYIGQETAKKGILDPKITSERIVEVRFNAEGTVTNVNDLDTQREDFPLETARTPTHGSELTFLQQMLGNLGRFNPPAQS